jgi:glycosyltransferase involved in cell wall biosynthesis
MRVLLISHTYIIRLNQQKIHELATLPGVEIRVVVPRWWRHRLFSLLLAENPIEAAFSYYPMPTLFDGFGGKYVYRSLDLTMREFQPDIVHTEECVRCLSLFQALIYKRIWAPHAKSVFFTCENIYVPFPPLLSFIERYSLSHADYAICGGQDAADVLRKRGFRGPISLVPQLGVDPDVFHRFNASTIRRQLKLKPQTFVIGFASRMDPEKGVLLLVEAAAKLLDDWALLLIGKGEEKERAMQRARELGVADKIRMIDPVPHLDFARYLDAMDVLVLPSYSTPKWKEQFAQGLLMAMSCQVPVIGSSSGEIPNVIGDAGLVFPEGDKSALTDCLYRLRTNPRLREDLIRKGVKRVEMHYTWRRIAEETYQVWEMLLN